ncbi:hypothetical protein FOXG_06978 [Fusarium oxysporum f. sp. lycopersici 4287]|uniref:Uncharacterized protein n=1 Tax=Fusarium oxysporum f. sp. lycopersici (strain 4287 / CBS 123668 / FGSC 9935 / NRRL 34936) TaxID=426428 RepID=A0A0J9WMV0_FUSO4|nr:hypothetical protein FOXG_06978 [Fusarium oxysporum f. sp. lycopersici 4287]KNB06167.1 hypothetical protein FOXG_06978 [Fusarium oxysporum f. sp. lycopersici 4287]
MANMKAKTGHLHDASRHLTENYNKRTQLNTYIYEYFLHNGMFQCAQSILKADSDVKVQRHSPGSDRNIKGLRLKNAIRNETIDTRLDSTHSNVLPAPNVPNLSPDSCFLYEWFCLFWAMFNAQKNESGRIEGCQYACNIQQRNWPKWNVSWPQTQSSSLLLQAPGNATHNAFYNSSEMGVGSMTPSMSGSRACGSSNEAMKKFQVQLTSMEQQNENEIIAGRGRSSLYRNYGLPGGQGGQEPIQSSKLFHRPTPRASRPGALPDTTKQAKLGTQPMNDIILDFPKAKVDDLDGNVTVVRMHDWTRASNSRTFQQPNSQTTRQSVAAKETPFQQEGKTDDKWSVQWQNDSSENQTSDTSQRGVQGTMQERFRLPPFQPADTNDNAKPTSTISSLSQTSKAALSTPQLSKAAREKIPFPKGTIPKKRTTNVKDEMVICKIPKLNVGSTATRPANAAASPMPHINPVGIWKDAQNSSLSQAVPTGQPEVALPLTPASMAANPPVDLVQSATFSMENCNMTDFASFPTFEDDFGGFDLGTFLESSAEDMGGFHFNYFPSNIDADNIDQS